MSLIRPDTSVVCTVLEEGGVLLHLETRYYYSVNPTGLAYWLALEDGVADPAAQFAARFAGVPGVRESVEAFGAELVRERLARADDAVAAGGGAERALSLAPGASWAPLRLTRHEAPLNQILSNPFDPCVPLAE